MHFWVILYIYSHIYYMFYINARLIAYPSYYSQVGGYLGAAVLGG